MEQLQKRFFLKIAMVTGTDKVTIAIIAIPMGRNFAASKRHNSYVKKRFPIAQVVQWIRTIVLTDKYLSKKCTCNTDE
jgi:hypothetical protein